MLRLIRHMWGTMRRGEKPRARSTRPRPFVWRVGTMMIVLTLLGVAELLSFVVISYVSHPATHPPSTEGQK